MRSGADPRLRGRCHDGQPAAVIMPFGHARDSQTSIASVRSGPCRAHAKIGRMARRIHHSMQMRVRSKHSGRNSRAGFASA